MPKYMVLGSYTSESWTRMVENPGDRSAVARKACENVGGNLEAFYWAFGPDDFVAIADVSRRCERCSSQRRGVEFWGIA